MLIVRDDALIFGTEQALVCLLEVCRFKHGLQMAPTYEQVPDLNHFDESFTLGVPLGVHKRDLEDGARLRLQVGYVVPLDVLKNTVE